MKIENRIAALADAIARMNCYHSPLIGHGVPNKAYFLRNPGLLRAFNPKHAKDEEGYRVFSNFSSGMDNLILDLQIKCKGGSWTKLTPENNLTDLICCYGNPRTAVRYIVTFLRHALDTYEVYETTRLAWFLEGKENAPAQEANEKRNSI